MLNETTHNLQVSVHKISLFFVIWITLLKTALYIIRCTISHVKSLTASSLAFFL